MFVKVYICERGEKPFVDVLKNVYERSWGVIGICGLIILARQI